MTEEKHGREFAKVERNVSALIEKFDTIAKALRTYINENSKRIEDMSGKVKGIDERMARIETIMENIKDYNAKIAKETNESSNLITGGFYDLKFRVEDVEMNILKTMKQKERRTESIQGSEVGNYGKTTKKKEE